MKSPRVLVALTAFLLVGAAWPSAVGSQTNPPALAWPAITREQRPWAYWWWMGSAVDKPNLTRELERYRDAGYGGVHIIPIYGAKGWEDRYLNFLSPDWMEMLRHTVSEAQRLDLGVDMTTGTGWCFGGPAISDAEANAAVVVKPHTVSAGGKLEATFDRAATQALVAFASDGKSLELTAKILADGSVKWTAPEGDWTVYAITQRPSGQKVKRAAPGGQGHMLNLVYPPAVSSWLVPFSDAFARYRGPKPRAQYHDSYEYRSDWSPDFFKQFDQRRGYRLQAELPALFGKDTSERAARVRTDYRETVSDIMIEDSLPLWVNWSHSRGFLTRNEAHGSPGNLLDLYALADIPETEMFRLDRSKLISKFASSAAHVAGRRLVGCETGTWLKEHFTETLADMKYLLDDLFVSGVNHVFYHGTCYSPQEAGWPGWVFYASYQMNPRNSIWHDAPALNAYVARCQSILQSGEPDNDILLYWPIHDFWHNAGPSPLLPHLTVHARTWFEAQPLGRAAEQLWNRGFSFDYVSDRQVAATRTVNNRLKTRGGNYRVVVVPVCERLPLETLGKLLALARSGATVIFEKQLPKDVPGLRDLEKRRAKFEDLLDRVNTPRAGATRPAETRIGKGRVLVGELEAALEQAGIARETMVDHAGLNYLRRSFPEGRHYFIANRGEEPLAEWVRIATPARAIVLMDPRTGRSGVAATRWSIGGKPEVFLQLQPGESLILRTFTQAQPEASRWPYQKATGESLTINGPWQVKFIQGGPDLAQDRQVTNLVSWTEFGGGEVQSFAGTARYTVTFDAPAIKADRWLLDLGRVCQSARVRLNRRDLGTLIIPPFQVVADELKPKDNVLEVEVTNVSANRIRDLDRRGVAWKNFHDINFVNQDYRPFDASNWPLYDSGLLGPVTLTPMERLKTGMAPAR
ncbi:MAG: hypothetical protein IH623_00120 [Verrucomicrobia bacterium]|nr:hypothetical protein [Verrucomicrobiota bacterium]